jgi:hypothetical protein
VFTYDRVRMPPAWRVDVLERRALIVKGVAHGSTVDG